MTTERAACLAILILALAALAVCVLWAAAAHAAQCNCAAPAEPPAVSAGLPKVQPGGGYVFMPAVSNNP